MAQRNGKKRRKIKRKGNGRKKVGKNLAVQLKKLNKLAYAQGLQVAKCPAGGTTIRHINSKEIVGYGLTINESFELLGER